jgi:hypothetical protein
VSEHSKLANRNSRVDHHWPSPIDNTSARTDQGLELLQLGRWRVVACEASRSAKLVDERMERTVLVVGRAEVAQAQTRLGMKALLQCRGHARLAEAGFTRDQHDLAVARLDARSAPQQQVDLLVAAD